jgi:hypothetical protein
MSMYKLANDSERVRLKRLVAGLSDADLRQTMPAGWTVAAILAHLAFWDQRSALLLDRWRQEGVIPPPDDEVNIDWINDASRPLFLEVSPRAAAALVILSAEAADRAVEQLPPDLVERNAEHATPVNLRRADHRQGHLDDIERALGRRLA